MMTSRRRPYVGAGADGARRSAQIDREEADVLDADDPRREALLESARRWEDEADWIESGAIARAERDGLTCRHCGDPIGERDGRPLEWVDENGLRSCAPLADHHEPEPDEATCDRCERVLGPDVIDGRPVCPVHRE